MFPLFTKIKNLILDIFFQPICLNCQKHLQRSKTTNSSESTNNYLCDNCYNSIKLNNTLFCPVCRARLAENKRICHYDSSYLLAAAGNYDDPALQNLIHYFKYKYFRNLAPILGEILIQYLNSLNPKFYILNSKPIVIPIPLHPRRERKRGFNQAKLIAEIVAQYFALPLIDGLKRIKNNKPQVNLKNDELRNKNVANCFKIKNSDFVQGKNIILVDDVFTSGATMNEAVKVLKENGAKRIIALVLAKAP
jgi:ComF family protein